MVCRQVCVCVCVFLGGEGGFLHPGCREASTAEQPTESARIDQGD